MVTHVELQVGLYILLPGKQSAMLGFLPLDEGDAPGYTESQLTR